MSDRQCFVLGVDGGGTSTNACIAAIPAFDEPRDLSSGALDPSANYRPSQDTSKHAKAACSVLGRGTGGPTNVNVVGWEMARRNMAAAIDAAIASAGESQRFQFDAGAVAFHAAGVGISGAGSRGSREQWESIVREAVTSHSVFVADDVTPLFQGSDPNLPTVVLIAGTGSIGMMQSGRLPLSRAGGWGPLIGDPGSGTWIGFHGLGRVSQFIDRGQFNDPFLERVLDDLGLNSPDEFRAWTRGPESTVRGQAAQLARTVCQLAETGDAVAAQILNDAARVLADIVASLLLRVDSAPKFDLVMSGGVFRGSAPLRDHVIAELRALGLSPAKLRLAQNPSVEVALWAHRQLNEPISEADEIEGPGRHGASSENQT